MPIITAGPEVPRYEKYRVDLDQLKNRGYIDQIPDTAFEKGGSGYFLIINEETEPTVKVMDLTTAQKVNDVQRAVNLYKMAHDNALPAEALYPGYTAVDLSKTDAKSVRLMSVYSGQEMTFMMDEEERCTPIMPLILCRRSRRTVPIRKKERIYGCSWRKNPIMFR